MVVLLIPDAFICLDFFFFQAEDGIRDYKVTGFRRVLFRSPGDHGQSVFPRGLSADAGPRRHGRGDPAWRDRNHPDRKSTRLNSSHLVISYAVFCLKKKKKYKI